jgi:hypothetical protein
MKKGKLNQIIKEELITVLKEFMYGGSLSQVNQKYKSNIPLKWKDGNDMVDDLKIWAADIGERNGIDGLQDLRAALKEVDETVEKLALDNIRSREGY